MCEHACMEVRRGPLRLGHTLAGVGWGSECPGRLEVDSVGSWGIVGSLVDQCYV